MILYFLFVLQFNEVSYIVHPFCSLVIVPLTLLIALFSNQQLLVDTDLHREWLRPGEEELVQRFDPSSPLDTIGFFIVKFVVGSKGT